MTNLSAKEELLNILTNLQETFDASNSDHIKVLHELAKMNDDILENTDDSINEAIAQLLRQVEGSSQKCNCQGPDPWSPWEYERTLFTEFIPSQVRHLYNLGD